MTGGTGFVGSTLTQKLTSEGHQVIILTRAIKKGLFLPHGASFLEGDPIRPGAWQEKVTEHEVVINLAGASIFRRWNDKARKEILESRTLTTNNIVEALSERRGKEIHLLNASAIGFYGFHGDESLDENSPPGDDFLACVVREWESAARKAQEFDVRVVLCRFGVVLGKHGGALSELVPIFKRWLGSPLGSGKQWFSWIHEEDLANVFLFLLEHKNLDGPINCTSPNPVRNSELTKTLGDVLGKPTFMPAVPGFALRLKMGEVGNVLLKGQRVQPRRLLKSGFRFQFANLRDALEDILRQ